MQTICEQSNTRARLFCARLFPGLLSLFFGLTGLLASGAARAGDALDLVDVLRLDEVIVVLRDEGLAYGAALDQDMLDGLGGAYWARQVTRVYDQGRMADVVRTAMLNGLNESQIAGSLAFFDTPRGQRILSLETSARVAMTDPGIEQIAFDTYKALKGSTNARLALVDRLIAANDLIERNVTGSLNSSFQFLRGLVDGGGSELSEAQITSEIWSQEDATRADTQEWLFGYMLLAYDPLNDADLEAYISYSETPAGRALNAALFDGFDAMYATISHTLGVLVAEASLSSDL